MTTWTHVEHVPYTAVTATVHGLVVTVCLDNEAPLAGHHAYFWDVALEHPDIVKHPAGPLLRDCHWLAGWEASVTTAKRAAIKAAREAAACLRQRP